MQFGDTAIEDLPSSEHFKFEASLMVHDACTGVITKAWASGGYVGDPLDMLQYKLERCKRLLLAWKNMKDRKKKFLWLKRNSEKIAQKQDKATVETMGEIKSHLRAHEEVLEREDLKWKQRAKVH